MRAASEMEDALAGLLVSEGSSTLAARALSPILSVEAAVLAEVSSRNVESSTRSDLLGRETRAIVQRKALQDGSLSDPEDDASVFKPAVHFMW